MAMTQIQAAMTPAQFDAIAAMKISQETAMTTAGGAISIRCWQQSAGRGLMGDLTDAFIQLLEERS